MFALPSDRPALMGILNVTPDSFSDGGLYTDFRAAVAAAERMMEEGADLVDVGGESTRPGAEDVPLDEELRRTIPVVRELKRLSIPVSIDTMKPDVARAALEEGADVANDVGGFRDPRMSEVVRPFDCSICVMHMQGTPRTMQAQPQYDDVVAEVRDYLLESASECMAKGIERLRIWIDPGIGFGKSLEHNLSLLKDLDALVATGFPVLVGVSRKSFLGRLLGDEHGPAPVTDRLEGSLAAQVAAQLAGAKIIRAHDVRSARRAIDVTAAITGGRG